MIVYALIDPRDKQVRYVGKTHRAPHRRLRRHLASCYLKDETHRTRWIRALLRLGLEPSMTVLQQCPSPQELAEAERFHIAHQRAHGARLTNATPGGDGGSGPHTPESREKIRRALTGKPKSAEHRRNSALGQRGRRASAATRAKLIIVRRQPRKPLTERHRITLSRAKGGHAFVDQLGNRYETQKGTARLLGINVGHLNEVLHGRRKSVAGYVFRFVREFPR